jgi:hypothetical protein
MTECCTTCLDCGSPSGDEPIALILPRRHWLLIHPGDDGYLCGHCMLMRVSKLPGVVNITGVITFGDDYAGPGETPYERVTRGALPVGTSD